MTSRFAAAFRFLTIVPLFRSERLTDGDMARAMGAFPAVGLVLGAGLAAIHLTVGRTLPPPLEGVVLAGALAWATGALHLDGVADTADGLAGGWTRERALEIMKDSRTGAVGAAALCLVVLAKALGLGLLPPEAKTWGLVVTPAVGRGAAVLLAHGSTYARPGGGLGAPYTRHLDGATVGRALLWAGVPCVVLGWRGLAAFGLVLLYTRALRRAFHRRLGGITGDVLGFGVETSEVLFLLSLHALVP